MKNFNGAIYCIFGKRIFDVGLSIFSLTVLSIPIIIISIFVITTSNGPCLYWSDRVGKGNLIFKMPKFRTMRPQTPEIATHLLVDSTRYLTPIGGFLRKSSLDELPQLWSILIGHMSFVGPRPALFNQYDLIFSRTELGVNRLKPGLTGWAQVNGRDELLNDAKLAFEVEYLAKKSFLFDMRILILTFIKVIKSHGISH